MIELNHADADDQLAFVEYVSRANGSMGLLATLLCLALFLIFVWRRRNIVDSRVRVVEQAVREQVSRAPRPRFQFPHIGEIFSPPARSAGVRIVSPSRVRLVRPGETRAQQRACRFCGLPLEDGAHERCDRGVLDD